MKSMQIVALVFSALIVAAGADVDLGRKLLQTVRAGTPPTITVSASNPNVNAITITLAIPYPQNAYFCNVTGDARLPQQGPFPITVRVPVGVTSTVIFANITGPIPGASCQMGGAAMQQPGKAGAVSVVQQNAPPTSIQQMVNNPTSVLQQGSGSTVVQQQYATSVNQQNSSISTYMNCVANTSSVVQQQTPATVVQQQGTATVVQQQGATKSPPTSIVQQPTTPTTVVQQSTAPVTVVQQSTPAATPAATKAAPTTVVQQSAPTTPAAATLTVPRNPPTILQQQAPPTTIVQQSTPSTIVQQGRKLLQAGTIEWISNNGSTGQPQLSVLDTTEGVPNISFKPTAAGQTAQFNGALQVAKTTTNDGFGTPYIPYQVDSRLSPQCGVQVNFVGF